jgi:hypothetical protein
MERARAFCFTLAPIRAAIIEFKGTMNLALILPRLARLLLFKRS